MRWNNNGVLDTLNPIQITVDSNKTVDVNFDYQRKFNAVKVRLITDYTKFSLNEKYNPLNKKNNAKRTFVEPSLGIEKENNFSLTSFKNKTFGTLF